MTEQAKQIEGQCIDIHEFDYDEGENKVTTYEDITGHQIGQHWVAVFTQGGETHIKKVDNISFIRVYTKE